MHSDRGEYVSIPVENSCYVGHSVHMSYSDHQLEMHPKRAPVKKNKNKNKA